MTMPARRIPTIRAKRRATHVFPRHISYTIPGDAEHWPECQPEHVHIWHWWSLIFFGVWTCIKQYLGCLDMYMGVRTCIWDV